MSLFARIDRASVWHVLVLCTFCALPWHQRASTWGIVLLLIHFLSDQHIIEKIKSIRINVLGYLSISFFLYHLVGMLWTDFPQDGWKSIEVKLCFLLLPLLFGGENHLTHRSFRAIMPYFLISGVLAFCYSLGYSYHKYHNFGWSSIFNRVNVAEGIMHPGYWSNYYTFGLIFICYQLWIYSSKQKWIYFLLLPLYFGIVVLLNSKTIYIVLALFIMFLLWKATAVIRNFWIRFSGFTIATVLVITLISLLPPIKRRLTETFRDSKPPSAYPLFASSMESRLAAWSLEKKLIRINPIIGYGTGSANPLLLESMKKHHYDDLVKYNMHTHNQVFHTWIDLGLLGLLLLLAFWIYALVLSAIKQNGMAFWTAFLCFVYLFTDDALEIQAVGVFIVYLLFLFQPLNRNQFTPQTTNL